MYCTRTVHPPHQRLLGLSSGHERLFTPATTFYTLGNHFCPPHRRPHSFMALLIVSRNHSLRRVLTRINICLLSRRDTMPCHASHGLAGWAHVPHHSSERALSPVNMSLIGIFILTLAPNLKTKETLQAQLAEKKSISSQDER
jgi:hypothetical protein